VQPKRKKPSLGVILFALAGIFACLFLAYAVWGTQIAPMLSRPTRTPTPDVGDQYGAYAVCKGFVKERLKAPSEAKFPTINDVRHSQSAGGVWTLEGFVDAPNSFGVMLRLDYTCRVSYVGGGEWKLEGVEVREK
jgi:hypothetical protein